MLRILLLLALPLSLLTSVSSAQVTHGCYGDGNGRACKCGNDDTANPASGGCLNSAGTGAVLSTNGNIGVAENDLQFTLAGGPPGALAVLTSGDNMLGGGIGILGLPVSDGLRCVGGNFKRHGGRALDAAGNRPAAWGAPGTAPLAGIIGRFGFVSGQTRHFQVRYRDDPMFSQCGFGTNTTQAISISFTPTTPVEPCDAAAQMACIAAGNEPCTAGVNSADCGPLIEVCTPAIQMACGDVGLLPCSPGINSAACGGDVCSPQAIFNCVQAGLSPCLPGTTTCEPPCTCTITELLACVHAGMGACIMGGNCACT